MDRANICGQGCRRPEGLSDIHEAIYSRPRDTVETPAPSGTIRRSANRDIARAMPSDLTTDELHHVIRTFMTRLGAHDTLSARSEWEIVEIDELKRLLAMHTWPTGSSPPEELRWCSAPLAHPDFPRFAQSAVFWRTTTDSLELWISERVRLPQTDDIVITPRRMLEGIAGAYRVSFDQSMLDAHRRWRRRRRWRIVAGFGFTYAGGPLALIGWHVVSPPASFELGLARIVSMASGMIIANVILVPLRRRFDAKFVFAITPLLIIYYSYAVVLVYNRIGWSSVPDAYLFGVSLFMSLGYGAIVASAKYRSPVITDIRRGFVATFSLMTGLALGTLQAIVNIVSHISIESASDLLGFLAIPALLYAFYELTRREFVRDE